jgi:uncharacterized protein
LDPGEPHEGRAPDRGAPGRDTLDHDAPVHDAPVHDAPVHDAPDRDVSDRGKDLTGSSPEAAIAAPVAKPPRIDAVMFARREEGLAGRTPLSSMKRLLAAGVGEAGMLDWEVDGGVVRDEMQRRREVLRVRTRFSPWMTCSRCLEPVQLAQLRTDTRFRLAATEAQAAAEDRDSEEFDVIAADPHLDLFALVEDEAILGLPMAPAHESCPGVAGVTVDPPVTL